MGFDAAAYEAMVRANMEKLYGGQGMAMPTALPTPGYAAPAAPMPGAGLIKPLAAIGTKIALKSLLAGGGNAAAAGAGATGAASGGLASAGAGAGNIAGLGVATPTGVSASVVPGASAATPGLGALGWAGPAAFMATAPLYLPYVSKLGGAVGKALGMNTDSNRWQSFDANKIAGYNSKNLDKMLPGFESLGQGDQAALLQRAQDLKFLNLPGIEGKHQGNEGLAYLTKLIEPGMSTGGNQFGKGDSPFMRRMMHGDGSNLIGRLAAGNIKWRGNANPARVKEAEAFINMAKGLLTKPPEVKK